MNTLSKLNLSCFYLHRAIPLAFDESMSYLEMCYAMLKSINDTIEIVNKHSEFIETYESQYEFLQAQINEINIKLNSILSDIDKRFDDIESTLAKQMSDLRLELQTLISQNYQVLKDYVDEQDARLEYLINNISIEQIMLRDPTTGLVSNIQVVIDNLFTQATPDGITAQEFDNVQITAQAFDNKNVTAYQFDTSSKLIFV